MAWEVLKSPLRGTDARHFDDDMKSGRIRARPPVPGLRDQMPDSVWMTGGEGYYDADTAFSYARGSGHGQDIERDYTHRVPLVHYVEDLDDFVVQEEGREDERPKTVRHEGDLDTKHVSELWRGVSAADWIRDNVEPLEQGLSDAKVAYGDAMRASFMDAWRNWLASKDPKGEIDRGEGME